MDTPTFDKPFRLTFDDRESFVAAVSVCARLEVLCAAVDAFRVMALVGLARCEITEYGSRVCDRHVPVTVPSISSGLGQLTALITRLLGESDDLAHVLRLHEARVFVEDAQALAV